MNGKTHVIGVREKDSYLNAVQLCKVGDRTFTDYMKSKGSQDYHTYLKGVMTNIITELIDIKQGGP